MRRTRTSHQFRTVFFLAVGASAFFYSAGMSAATVREFTEVGVLVAPASPVYAACDSTAGAIDTVVFGDVLFVSDSVPSWTEEESILRGPVCQVLLPDNRLGWVGARALLRQPLDWLAIRISRRGAVLWDSIPQHTPLTGLDSGVVLGELLGGSLLTEPNATQRYYHVKWHNRGDSRHAWPIPAGYVSDADAVLICDRFLMGAARSQSSRTLLSLVLTRYGDSVFLEPLEWEYEPRMVRGAVQALSYLADLDELAGEYQRAIDTLEQIASRYPTDRCDMGVAGGVAKMRIAKILAEKMTKPREAAHVCQALIRDYPAEAIEGFEWNSTLDIAAVEVLADISARAALPDEELLGLFQWVIDSAGFDVVRMMAYMEKAGVYKRMGRFRDAELELMSAIKRHPSANFTFYLANYSLAESALDQLCRMYSSELFEPEAARIACETIAAENADSTLTRTALYFIAETYDATAGDRDSVLAAYRRLLQDTASWLVGLLTRASRSTAGYPEYIGRDLVENRVRGIESFHVVSAPICCDSVHLLVSPDSLARSIAVVPQDTRVTVLYTRDFFFNRPIVWCKVKTAEGVIGWVLKDCMELPSSEEEDGAKNE